MKLKDMHIEELELMSYTDMTYMILKENNKAMNTPTIFREICNLLDYTEEEYVAKIGDYYTSLTLDKRFVELVMDDDDAMDADAEEENGDDFEEEVDEDEIDNLDEIVDDDLDTSDIDDLEIVTDEELDEDN